MGASIADPFLLSNYTHSKNVSASAGPSKSASVYATQQHASTSAAGSSYVAVAAQGDGVHVLDVSTLHPVISHTLGPSASFSCPAATVIAKEDDSRTCTIYAVMESAQDIPSDERGRTVWVWKENLFGEVGSIVDRKKQTLVLPHRIFNILVAQDLPGHVLLVGVQGELTISDTQPSVRHSYTPSDFPEEYQTFKSFVFPRKSASFAPHKVTPKQGAVVVTVLRKDREIQVQVLAVDENATIASLGMLPIPAQQFDIVDVSCSESGWISILTRSGDWNIVQLHSPDYTTLKLVASPSIPIRNMSFLSGHAPDRVPAPKAAVVYNAREISILSLGSSHVLLSGVVSGADGAELALLLWDLQYSVLLASHLFALPSSVTRTKHQGIELTLSGSSAHTSQVLLTITSKVTHANGEPRKGATGSDGARRSSVLVVPVTVPETSTIAAAIGRGSAGERWLYMPTKPTADGLTNLSEIKFMRTMLESLKQKNVSAAEEAFTRMLRILDEDSRRLGLGSSARLEREFVKRVLETLFKEKDKSGADTRELYPRLIVRLLLERRVVSNSMLPGGLLPALRTRNDWTSILLALENVPDLPENDIVLLLQLSVANFRKTQSQGDNAMQVDGAAGDVPSLKTILPLCVLYPVSAPALRLAIRKHLSDPDDLMCVLQALADWLKTWSTQELSLLPANTRTDPHGATVPVFEETPLGIPPVDQILIFLQTLLDGSLLTFLSHPQSLALLREVLAQIEPELSFMNDVDQLRGVLQPFVKAQAKHVREAAVGAAKPDLSVDWRRRRKEQHEQAAIAVGVYQIEELVL